MYSVNQRPTNTTTLPLPLCGCVGFGISFAAGFVGAKLEAAAATLKPHPLAPKPAQTMGKSKQSISRGAPMVQRGWSARGGLSDGPISERKSEVSAASERWLCYAALSEPLPAGLHSRKRPVAAYVLQFRSLLRCR